MSQGNITNLAFIRAKPGKTDSLINALKELAKGTREEPGSLVYEVHRSKSDSDQFFVYEIWNSQAYLDAHMKGLGIQSFISKVGELVSGDLDLRAYLPVDVVRA